MKKTFILISLLIGLFILPHFCLAQDKTDWQKYFSKQDLVFDSVSNKWEEGAFIGNGLLGVMVYRQDANTLRFELGRTDVVDHREGINPSLGLCRLPIGKFLLHPAGKVKDIQLRMNLWNAEIIGKIITDKGEIDLQALVVSTKDVIILNTKNSSGEKDFKWEWKPQLCESPYRTLKDTVTPYKPNPQFVLSENNGINYCYQALLAGGSHTTAWKMITKGDNQKSVYITISNSYPKDNSKNLADELITSSISQDQNSLIAAHRTKWHQFYGESFLSIPDSRLQSFYWAQQYKMASATRADSRPIDLMGPWYKDSPWPKYWFNLNIQLTYYPVFSSNHLELAKPLIKMVSDNLGNLIKNVPEEYQYNAAGLGRSGPYEMTAGIKAKKGNDSTGGSAASLETGDLTWLMHVCWQDYEYSHNEAVMKTLYPILTRSINFYLDIMDKEADGKWHLPYTYSPEYPRGIGRDNNYDLALFKWGLKTLLYISDQLKDNNPLVSKWTDALANLTPYPQDKLGLRIGRDASFDISHRHYSHMLMIYPLYELNWDQPENRPLIEKSLTQWETNNKAWRGYSYTGSGSIYAMMGRGDKTLSLLNDMMDKGRYSIKPNTMYTEAGPVIETPLSAVTTINEMVLQSWNGIIRPFPAIPAIWKDASFGDLLAKGAFEVSGVRKNGVTSYIKIKSLAGIPCLVKTDWKSDIKTEGKRSFKISNRPNGVIEVDLKKGEEVILYTGKKPSSFNFEPVAGDKNINYWGLHKMNK
jgi:alpha-L-fucosidase 2